MGIFLHPTEAYAIAKAALSPERQKLLELVEEDIASDPDRDRFEENGIRYEFSDEFVSVSFRRTGRYDGDLIDFKFYEDT